MSVQVIFDRILGRLREKDYETGGGGVPSVPDPSRYLVVETTPMGVQRYFADYEECPEVTVTVRVKFNNQLVDAAEAHPNWEHPSTGIYQRTLNAPGVVASEAWTYVPGGVYLDHVAVANSKAFTLKAVYPAYWGIWPGNDTSSPDITDVVAALNQQQRRVTQDISNLVLNVPNDSESRAWLWIVTKGSASALNAEFNIPIIDAPVEGMEFISPVNNQLTMQGYRAYLSQNSAAPGLSFGNVKLSISLYQMP